MSRHVVTSTEYSRNSRTNGLLMGLLYVLFGLVTVICGQGMLDLIVTVVGALILIFGIIAYVQTRSIDTCLLGIIVGIIFIILGQWGLASSIIRVLFGVLIILGGIMVLLGANVKVAGVSLGDKKGTVISYVIGIVMVVLGIIAMINWGGSFDILIRVIGLIILVLGVINIGKTLGIVKE